MNFKHLLPKKKVKSLCGVRVFEVHGSKEILLAHVEIPLSVVGAIEVKGELVCEPIFREVYVHI